MLNYRKILLDIAGADAGDVPEDVHEIRGEIDTIAYTPDATAPYDNGATLAVEIVTPTGHNNIPVLTGIVLDSAGIFRPRASMHEADGTEYTFGTDLPIPARIVCPFYTLRFTVTNGGDGNTGAFLLIVNMEMP